MEQRRRDNGWGIIQLWFNWMIGSGMITLLVILSLWVKALYMPFVAFFMQFLLFVVIRRNREKQAPSCYILPFIVSRILFWTGLAMVVLNFLYSDWLVDAVFDPTTINREIPFICVLIVAPISAIISGWGYVNRKKLSFCADCKMRNGSPAERGFLGVIFTQVGVYQVGFLFWMSAILTIVCYVYYALFYLNESLSLPDRFFYVWLPTLVWLFSAVYLGLRYLGIWGYYQQNVEGSLLRAGKYTRVRYLMVWADYMCVAPPEVDADRQISLDEKFDTPVATFIPRRDNVSQYDAEVIFNDLTGTKGVEVRFMYKNVTGNIDCNIFHYLAFLNDEQKAEFDREHPECQWISLPDVAYLVNNGLCNPLMSAEVVRLHTVAMAWKTYHPDGRRRYKIKHYKPTFRICDIHSWDVDYNDSHWLYVADNNQDTPLYKLRKFWRKYVNGVGQ